MDPCFSTERVAIIHEGIIFSRLDKVRDLATWPVAIENLRVCSTIVPGYLNCGFCEKCVRTKLELMAVGLEIPNTFKNRTMEAAQLPVFRIKYQSSCYRDVVVPLKERGHDKLAKAIEQRLLLSPLLNAVKKADEKWTGGNLTKTVRRIKPSAWQKSRM